VTLGTSHPIHSTSGLSAGQRTAQNLLSSRQGVPPVAGCIHTIQLRYVPISRLSFYLPVLTVDVFRTSKLHRSIPGVARDADCACDHRSPLRCGICSELQGPRLGRSAERSVCACTRPVDGCYSPENMLNKQSTQLSRLGEPGGEAAHVLQYCV
jgi:hypothetical protein